MAINETRKRLLRQLNSRYILGKYVRRPTPRTPRWFPAKKGDAGRARDVVDVTF